MNKRIDSVSSPDCLPLKVSGPNVVSGIGRARRATIAVIAGTLGIMSCAKSLSDLAPFPCGDDGTCPLGFACQSGKCLEDRSGGNQTLEPCDADTVCASGNVCVHVSNGNIGLQCLPSCKLFSADCSSSTSCALAAGVLDGRDVVVSACVQSGKVQVGSACDGANLCGANSVCYNVGSPKCVALCDSQHKCSQENYRCNTFSTYTDLTAGICVKPIE